MTTFDLILPRVVDAILFVMMLWYQFKARPVYQNQIIAVIIAGAVLVFMTTFFPVATNIRSAIKIFMDIIILFYVRHLSKQ